MRTKLLLDDISISASIICRPVLITLQSGRRRKGCGTLVPHPFSTAQSRGEGVNPWVGDEACYTRPTRLTHAVHFRSCPPTPEAPPARAAGNAAGPAQRRERGAGSGAGGIARACPPGL